MVLNDQDGMFLGTCGWVRDMKPDLMDPLDSFLYSDLTLFFDSGSWSLWKLVVSPNFLPLISKQSWCLSALETEYFRNRNLVRALKPDLVNSLDVFLHSKLTKILCSEADNSQWSQFGDRIGCSRRLKARWTSGLAQETFGKSLKFREKIRCLEDQIVSK